MGFDNKNVDILLYKRLRYENTILYLLA